jgi:hypothetical protein
LRDLSPEPGGSGSPKVQGDEAARLLDHLVNEKSRGTRATVRDGFPFPALGTENTVEIGKMQKFAFNWKQFPVCTVFDPKTSENPQPQNSVGEPAAKNARGSSRLSQVQDRAKRRASRN